MKRCLFLVALTLTWLGSLHGQAAGLFIPSEPGEVLEPGIRPPTGPRIPPRPFPFPAPERRHPWFSSLELKTVRVATRIQDQIATTKLEEEFYNPNPRPVEGTFLLPLPKGAHVDKFTMEIGGQAVQAELLDAEKARRLYEDIVRKCQDPALLEYAGRDLLKARIFPIPAHGRKRVMLSYTELLRSDSGLARYAFPLSGGKFSAAAVESVSVKIDLQTSNPLKSVYSPTHALEVRRHGPREAVAGFELTRQAPESDLELFFSSERDQLGFSLLAHRDGPDDGYFLLLASPGVEPGRKVIPKDVAFVLDTSGSMAGAKLEQAKRALGFCVENLNDSDRFEVLRFSTETEPLFGKLVEGSSENRARASSFIKQLKPIGGTAIEEALRRALDLRPAASERPYLLVFLTDGRPTVGITGDDAILARLGKRQEETGGKTRVFCFGIGNDVNTHLLDRIAEETRAVCQYVLPEEDIEVKVSNFFSKIKEPVLADLKLATTADTRLLYPRDLPDLFQGEQLVVVGRYSKPGRSVVTLTGNADGEHKKFTYRVEFPESAPDHAFLPRLWATRRVGYLLDQIRLHGENAELRQEVAQLARQYGIVTPYTAYLILEDENQRNVPLTVQSLPQLREDRPAQEMARQFYSSANREKTGATAVAGARYGLALRQAENVQDLSSSQREAARGLAAAAPMSPQTMARTAAGPAVNAPGAQRLAEYAQQSQFVNGRNFFLNNGQWVDATVQNYPNAKRVRVQFNSPEYFNLLRDQPAAAPWLGLGRNLEFVANNTVYQVFE